MNNSNQNQYLTYEAASEFTGYKVASLRNYVSQGILKLNVHYLKPRRGKVLFLREALENWIRNGN
jgi:hypothetical protein